MTLQLKTAGFNFGGTYILAISGGVDSVVMLDLIAADSRLKTCTFVVVHVEHGIREDSGADLKNVRGLAKKYDFSFRSAHLDLGSHPSEQLARTLRYDFLLTIKNEYDATGIVTAHHQDDVVETMILNILRGTNRKGLASLVSTPKLLRPLLAYEKSQLITYAKANNLSWREDSTNQDSRYLRNYLRNVILPKLPAEDQEKLVEINRKLLALNQEIDMLVAEIAKEQIVDKGPSYTTIDRHFFICSEGRIAKEVLKRILDTSHNQPEITKQNLKAAWLFIKTAKTNKKYDFNSGVVLKIQNENEVILL